MKQRVILLVGILISTMSYAQFEISAGTGYAIGSAEMKLGTETTITSVENTYGSYGEGVNFQLRGTYFFNEKVGLDLGVGYLNGADHTINKTTVPGVDVDAIARGRAFGATVAVAYKFTDNFYGRVGALLKVAGKTEAVVFNSTLLSEEERAPYSLPEGSYSETNYVEDYHGKFPLGFVGALGYKFPIDNNFSIYVEAEYYGISLKRKDSELQEFNTNLFTPDGNMVAEGVYTLDNLPPGYVKKTNYVDELRNDNTDPSKKLSQKVPYSSFGINVGVTYKFKKSAKKQ
ncbi:MULTISPECIES: outer membrane beta-barrel protein [unclassified Cellulophaga]|uniref:outer membrane beta-barrel protein n=1 Tax=unclassified Cellulophaga TaxID=2634405 RepID=UPI0026E2A09B|nr:MULTISPECIES: outer membrane beta-barrel protein [unclassified Cellulophaga]MDO6490459.1 outer membrane beta-barrel protein [Cellulophaga sp. 2_MG-2023]MDO6494347.1 outer membrane beta-barrel protein [Cellulophaga sp. 3_MG-2023]